MELIVAILMALGFLTSPDLYNDEYRATRQAEIDRANYVIDNNYYREEERDGGVIIVIEITD